uniref:PH domain-containing protein n=1 Tax=Timema shepardi TaxID=629360 RepID=A0A7R9G0C2_TIMSH|nr:unnamed protein product [Timema shepardi]
MIPILFLLQSLLSGKSSEIHAIKKGLLWQQRDRIFSRWKERYFILTRDYLHCFKRASGEVGLIVIHVCVPGEVGLIVIHVCVPGEVGLIVIHVCVPGEVGLIVIHVCVPGEVGLIVIHVCVPGEVGLIVIHVCVPGEVGLIVIHVCVPGEVGLIVIHVCVPGEVGLIVIHVCVPGEVKLADVERVDWINRKTYSTIVLELGREGRVLLRAADGLEDWFELLELANVLVVLSSTAEDGEIEVRLSECMMASKERRRALRSSHDPSLQQHNGTLQNNNSINSTLDEWLLARHKIGCVQHLSDSVPDLNGEGNSRGSTGESSEEHQEENQWLRRRPPNHEQRLSLLTDIDINDSDTLLDTPPPSVTASIRGRPTSYRLNSDVFFMSPAVPSEASERLRYGGGTATPSFCSSRPVLTPVGSFRSTHLFNPSKMAADRYSVMSDAPQLTRYRERAHSEVHKLERHNWKMKAETNRRTSFMVHATQV